MKADQVRYDVEAVLSNGMRVQGSSDYVWPDAETLEAQGAWVAEVDTDGTPLVVIWKDSGRISLNGEQLSPAQIALRVEAYGSWMEETKKWTKKKKGFWQL